MVDSVVVERGVVDKGNDVPRLCQVRECAAEMQVKREEQRRASKIFATMGRLFSLGVFKQFH